MRVLGRDAEAKLAIAQAEGRPLDAVAADFKLVADALYAYTGHVGAVAASPCDQKTVIRERPSCGRLQLPGVRLSTNQLDTGDGVDSVPGAGMLEIGERQGRALTIGSDLLQRLRGTSRLSACIAKGLAHTITSTEERGAMSRGNSWTVGPTLVLIAAGIAGCGSSTKSTSNVASQTKTVTKTVVPVGGPGTYTYTDASGAAFTVVLPAPATNPLARELAKCSRLY